MRNTEHSASRKRPDGDQHYVRAVTRMGDSTSVVAAEDIFGSHGVKLLAKGSRVDSRVLDKLLGHNLRQPIDHSVTAEAGVSTAVLAKAAGEILATDIWWRAMADRSGDAIGIRDGLSRLQIPRTVCFRLTVAREQRPTLYRHSLRAALLCHYLAIRLGLSPADTERLLLAALCHDLGELHTDPAILDAGHRISDKERRFVYVHPTTGYLILRDIADVHPEVARAVLHHHERLDGSGYPSGLRGDAISPLAQLLAVAEVAESVLTRFADHRRLSVLLRLNLSKYHGGAISMLHEALGADENRDQGTEALPFDNLNRQLSLVSRLLSDWLRFRATLPQAATPDIGPGLGFLFERMGTLHMTLRKFGFDPDSFETLAGLAEEDAEIAAELNAAVEEMTFQFSEMARELARHEEAAKLGLPAAAQDDFSRWKQELTASFASA